MRTFSHPGRRIGYLTILLICSVLIYLSANELFNREVRLVFAGLIFGGCLLGAIAYGTSAGIIGLLGNAGGFPFLLTMFINTGDYYFLALAMFQFTTGTASLITGILADRERDISERYKHDSLVDSVTGAFNVRYLKDRLGEEVARAERDNTAVSVLFLDLDSFKVVNDLHGHARGDEVLRSTAQFLQRMVRSGDVVCRYGGDEFTVILPSTRLPEAQEAAERIRQDFEENVAKGAGELGKSRLSVSVGCSEYPALAENADALLAQSDAALYGAKHSGRDAVRAYEDVFAVIRNVIPSATDSLITTIRTTLWAISSTDRYTYGHSERVAESAKRIAVRLGLSEKHATLVFVAGLLHDLGRARLPARILVKKGRTTRLEMEQIRKHSEWSLALLPEDTGTALTDAVLHHHERWDGNGYPAALAETRTPRPARMLAVADAIDAMQTERPHRKALPQQAIIEQLERGAGSQFDPEIATVAVEMIRDGSL